MNRIEKEQKIVEMYKNGYSGREIIKQTNWFKTTKSVYDILRKHQVPIRGPSLSKRKIKRNSSFFDRITTPEQAYVLGLFTSDGWLTKNDYIGFASKDKELVEIPKNLIAPGATTTIRNYDSRNLVCGRVVNRNTIYQFQLCDKEIANSLKELGFSQEKTFNEIYPVLNPDLDSHFIRGIFDGDGCVYQLSTTDLPGVIFYSGSETFLLQLEAKLDDHLNIQSSGIKPQSSIYKTAFYSKENTRKLYFWLYEQSENLRCIRKYEKYSSFKNCQH